MRMKHSTLVLSALVALTGPRTLAQDFVTITPTGASSATVVSRWAIASDVSGLGYIDGNSGFPDATVTNFFTITGAAIPAGGSSTGFTSYLSTGTASSQASVGNALAPNSYSGLTYVTENLGLIGPLSFYSIHHNNNGDYLALIQPSVPTVSDQKPMSAPGGPLTPGATGYFALSYATDNPGGWGSELFYYLRTNSLGETIFGSMIPALISGPTDQWNLGAGHGFTDLAYASTNVGFGASKFYYLRLDPVTQTTFFGWLDPLTGTATDIQDLGGVYRTLTFTTTNVGYGANNFYSVSQPPAPIITNNPLTAAGTVGTPFSFAITASGSPTVYSASPLPAGLSIVAATGAITGTPTAVGTTSVLLGATNVTGTGNATLTITVAAAGVAPIITNNPLTAAGTVGTPFSFAITASGSPTSYSASSLPAGLSIVAATGAITGTPTAVGISIVSLGATNITGTGNATLTITIAPADFAPAITSPINANVPGTVGTPFVTYTIAATGSPTSFTATGLPPGLTLNSLTGAINGTPTTAGTYVETIGARNNTGTGTATLVFAVAAAGVLPIITSPPTASGTVGTAFVTYPITATGLPTSYTATGLPPGLTLNLLTAAINGTPTTAGTYIVMITATNPTGTSTSTVTMLIAPFGFSHIINFSARAMSGPASDTLIVGFVVSGDGKNLLVRGVGPSLVSFGITNFLADPILTLFTADGTIEATDSGWQVNSAGQDDGALIAATAASVGAFPLANDSMDSALLVTVDNGVHTTGLLTTNGAQGVGLIEIYDTGGNAYASLINVSARMEVSGGDGILIAGLVIGGNAPKTVLIRGVGPTLSVFGVSGVLGDPQITVFSGTTEVASNTNWGTGSSTAAQLSAVFAQVGAFPLPVGSKDAALLLSLDPGTYTVQVTSVSGSTGVALVEVYDTQ